MSRRSTMRTSRRLSAGVTLLLLAAGLCGAQNPDSTKVVPSPTRTEHVDALFHGHGFDATGGIHGGVPALLSIALGPKLWLGDAFPGAIFVTGEPGLLDLRYGAGYQIFDGRLYGLGVAARVGRLVSWTNALGAARAVRYTGTEFAVSWAFALSARVGTYAGRAKDGNRVVLGTIDLGLGF